MARNLDASVDQRFSSRLGFLLSVIGIAVGTGNIWRFPRIAAQNGSDEGAGAFLIAWTLFLFLWSVPLVLAKYAMGRKCRMGVVGTIARMAGEKFAWMGAFMTFVTAAIRATAKKITIISFAVENKGSTAKKLVVLSGCERLFYF